MPFRVIYVRTKKERMVHTMTIDFNVRGSIRKDLGKALSEHTGMESHYNGVAKQTYSIGDLTITREGFLDIPEDWPQEDVKDLVAFLKTKGYTPVDETEVSEVEITEGTLKIGRASCRERV